MQWGMAPPILFSDARLVILNKPAGLPCHPGPRASASVEDWFPELSRRRAGPWLVHRLDSDTAGCLAVALRRATLLTLQTAFAEGRVGKVYWAVVRGGPNADSGTLDLPLGKHSDRAGWRMRPDPDAPPAITDWRVRARFADTTWLELHPRTGRTHQVRAHCAALGCPVAGDAIYGDGAGRLQLLARAILLPLDPPVAATAPVPGHMHLPADAA